MTARGTPLEGKFPNWTFPFCNSNSIYISDFLSWYDCMSVEEIKTSGMSCSWHSKVEDMWHCEINLYFKSQFSPASKIFACFHKSMVILSAKHHSHRERITVLVRFDHNVSYLTKTLILKTRIYCMPGQEFIKCLYTNIHACIPICVYMCTYKHI